MNGLFSVSILTLFIVMISGCSSKPTADSSAVGMMGRNGLVSISIVPFKWQGKSAPPGDVAAVISADLQRSGRFKTLPQEDILARPTSVDGVEFKDWRALGIENLVIGQVKTHGVGSYQIQFHLLDVFRGEQLTGYSIPTTVPNLRITAHRIADLIYEKLLGVPGAFATRFAYITSTRQANGETLIKLSIADADGYNPQTIVTSTEPLMSPSWSPDGKMIAYTSLEGEQSAIYMQGVYTGTRQKITSFKGTNETPAWSPDGGKLALALADGNKPDIYIYDLTTHKLTAITRNDAIDTEPSWSPDGRSIVFTSDRGGEPQIYRVATSGGLAQRMTFQNSYNSCASYSPDGKLLTMVTRENQNYRIAIQDLESGVMQVLSRGSMDVSPSFAPNGSMVIYASKQGGRDVLETVSVDGRVRQRFALEAGDASDPVWSPFL